MKRFFLVAAGLAALGIAHAGAQDRAPDPSRERVELARRIYGERLLHGLRMRLDRTPNPDPHHPSEDPLFNEAMAEDLHKWSLRRLEAECDAAADRAGRVAAAQAHLDRMAAVASGRMVRQELADHPLVKEMSALPTSTVDGKPSETKINLVDVDVKGYRELQPVGARRYLDVARYFRLEAASRLAREKAGR